MTDIKADSPNLIKRPHVDSFRRFFHIDELHDGKKYEGFLDRGLKRILSRVLPATTEFKDKNGDKKYFEVRIKDYYVKHGSMIFRRGEGKATKGITIFLILSKGIYDDKNKCLQEKDEILRLCTVPEITDEGYFRFKTEKGELFKCPVGQIKRAPGISRELDDKSVGYIIRPHVGKRLEVLYHLAKQESGFFLVSLSKEKKTKITISEFLDYLNAKENQQVKEFLHPFISPQNPLRYDITPLGRININRILGGKSDNTVLEENDILLLIHLLLKTPFEMPLGKDLKNLLQLIHENNNALIEIIHDLGLRKIGIDEGYLNVLSKITPESNSNLTIEDAEKISLIKRLCQNIQELHNKGINSKEEIKSKIEPLVKENHYYLLKNQLRELNHGETDFPTDTHLLDQYHLINKKVNLTGDYFERIFREHFIKVNDTIAKVRHEFPSRISKSFGTYLGINSLQQRIENLFTKNNMIQTLNQCNPLAEVSHRRKLTFFAMSDGEESENTGRNTRVALGLRDIHYSMHSRICPIDTPQGPTAGLNVSLAMYADIDENGILLAPHINNKITGVEYHDVGFDEKNEIVPYKESPQYRFGGREIIAKNKKEIKFRDAAPNQIFGLAGALIPFIGHDDAARTMMATSMMKQAIPLKNPEIPHIKTGYEKVVAEESRWSIRSRTDGIVQEIKKGYIKVGEDIYPLSWYRPTLQKTIFHQEPVVKLGDNIKKGQLIASGTCTVNGELTLGINMLTAFMFYKGLTYEDAIVISESASKKLTSLRVTDIECSIKANERFSNLIDGGCFEHLDNEGIVKVGTEIRPGDVLIGKIKKIKPLKPTDSMDKLFRLLDELLGVDVNSINCSYKAPEGLYGKVIEVRRTKQVRTCLIERIDEMAIREKVFIRVLSESPAQVGDKLANRHGNKGVISKILPDDQMPHMPNGTPVEIILNPLGVFNRMNIGQLLEMHLSWYVRNTETKSIVCPQFMERTKIEGLMQQGFNKAGLDKEGKSKLKDGKEGMDFSMPVAVGYIYTMKLNHMSADKINIRSTDLYSRFFEQAFQGRRLTDQGKTLHGGQRIGEMEVWALEAYNTPELLKELLALKSDDITGRQILLQNLKNGNRKSIDNYLPYSFKQMVSIVRGLCIHIGALKHNAEQLDLTSEKIISKNIEQLSNSLMAHNDIISLSNGRLGSGDEIIKEGDLTNQKIFGMSYALRCRCGLTEGNLGKKCTHCRTVVARRIDNFNFRMGYIELPSLIPHPLMEKEVKLVLGKDIEDFIDECFCEQSQNPGHTKTTSEKIEDIHRNIDLLITECNKILSRNNLKRTDRENYGHKLSVLKMIKDGKCIFIRYLPVIPLSCRFSTGDGEPHPFYKSYAKVIKTCNNYQILKQNKAPNLMLTNEYKNLYARLSEHFEVLLSALKGKEGIIRRDLLGKRVDFSGRIVVVPDPELKMDECALPVEILGKLFSIEISRVLTKNMKISSFKEYERYLRDHIMDEDFHNSIKDIINNRVILLNRFPTLHRMNIQAFYPRLTIDENIMKIPVTICAGFNADFDGDQFSIHLPISYNAQKEAKELCLPSKNIVSPASGLLTPVSLNKDIIAGLYWLTMKHQNEEWLKFTSLEEAYKYVEDKCKGTDYLFNRSAIINGIQTTIGRLIFNNILGNNEQTFLNETVTHGILDRSLQMYGEKYGYDKLVSIIEKVKILGFQAAHLSGINISYFDLPDVIDCSEPIFSDPENPDNEAIKKLKRNLEKELKKNFEYFTSSNASIIFMSGAGKKSSMFQIHGFRDKMARPDGSEVPSRVMSNFRRGLSPLEYFVSGHGARKGATDKAISTTKSGHLMRKIVEAVQYIRIGGHDKTCSSDNGIIKTPLTNADEKEIIPLSRRIYLRYAAEDVRDGDDQIILESGKLIDKESLLKITDAGIKTIRVMSPISCSHDNDNICYKCYGNDFYTSGPLPKGQAVGIIAAQSVSEPCTQLAMRVFHKGGIAEGDITDDFGRLLQIFEARNRIEMDSLKACYRIGTSYFTESEFKKSDHIEKLCELVQKDFEFSFGSNETEKLNDLNKILLKPALFEIAEEKNLYKDKNSRAEIQEFASDVAKEYRLNPNLATLSVTHATVTKCLNRLILHAIYPELAPKCSHGKTESEINEMLRTLLIDEIQRIFLKQGINIDDRHIEVILKEVIKNGEPKGIKTAAAEREGFLSNISFENIQRQLVKTAMTNTIDTISGLKERVLITKFD